MRSLWIRTEHFSGRTILPVGAFLLIIMSEKASREYIEYLNDQHISWIVCGSDRIDLNRACEILSAEFGVKRAAVVGGRHINAAFLAAGLLDEVSVLIGDGIDGRGGMEVVFDGLPMDRPVTPLKRYAQPLSRDTASLTPHRHTETSAA